MSLYTWKKPWLWLLAHGVDWKQAEGNPTQFLRELFCQRHCSFLGDKLISPGRSLLHRGLRHLWPSPVLLRNVPFCPGMLSWALELTWFISDSPACAEWRTGEGRCSAEDPQPQGGWSWAQSSHLRAPPHVHTTSVASMTERRDVCERARRDEGSRPRCWPQSASFQGDRGGSDKTRGKATLGVSSTRLECILIRPVTTCVTVNMPITSGGGSLLICQSDAYRLG